jgi:hypothetical protein
MEKEKWKMKTGKFKMEKKDEKWKLVNQKVKKKNGIEK